MGPWAAEGTTLPYVTGLARNGTHVGTAFLAVMRRSAQGGTSKLVYDCADESRIIETYLENNLTVRSRQVGESRALYHSPPIRRALRGNDVL